MVAPLQSFRSSMKIFPKCSALARFLRMNWQMVELIQWREYNEIEARPTYRKKETFMKHRTRGCEKQWPWNGKFSKLRVFAMRYWMVQKREVELMNCCESTVWPSLSSSWKLCPWPMPKSILVKVHLTRPGKLFTKVSRTIVQHQVIILDEKVNWFDVNTEISSIWA